MMTKFNLIVNIEVAENKGEDTNIVFGIDQQNNKNNVVIGVFDGLGGRSAGFDGQTGGQIASKRAAEITEKFLRQYRGDIDSEELAIQLQNEICASLKREADQKMGQSRLKGSLANKRLCSTIALVSVPKSSPNQNSEYDVKVVWMGDSRIYLLDPEKGLQQLTKDDLTVKKDALEMITEDPPMSQYLTADISDRWQINYHCYSAMNKACLLACTDGCFQYLRSPWEFETILLQTLIDSPGETREEVNEQWQHLLSNRYQQIKQDDVSLLIYSFGFSSAKEVKKSYQSRLEYLKNNFPTDVNNQDLQALWDKYRVDYEYYLNNLSEDNTSTSREKFYTSTLSVKSSLNNFEEDTSNKVNELLSLGNYRSDRKSFDEAIKYYEELIQLAPNHIEATFKLGIAYMQKSKLGNVSNKSNLIQDAKSCFSKVIEQNREYLVQALLYRAHISYQTGKYFEIIRDFNQIYQLPESNVREYLRENHQKEFADSLRKTLRWDDSLAICNLILKNSPYDPEVLYWIGYIKHQQNCLEEAEDYLKKSIQEFENDFNRMDELIKLARQELEQVKRKIERDRDHYL